VTPAALRQVCGMDDEAIGQAASMTLHRAICERAS
jgi:hypothetical protein